MMNVFIIISTIMFCFLASVWSRKTFMDFFVKITLWILTFYGVILILEMAGYLIKK